MTTLQTGRVYTENPRVLQAQVCAAGIVCPSSRTIHAKCAHTSVVHATVTRQTPVSDPRRVRTCHTCASKHVHTLPLETGAPITCSYSNGFTLNPRLFNTGCVTCLQQKHRALCCLFVLQLLVRPSRDLHSSCYTLRMSSIVLISQMMSLSMSITSFSSLFFA